MCNIIVEMTFLIQDAAVQPSLVLVYFGGNDSSSPHPTGLGPHVPLDEYVENMKKIALHLKVPLFQGIALYYMDCWFLKLSLVWGIHSASFLSM